MAFWKFDADKARWIRTERQAVRGITAESVFDTQDLFSISELYHENTKTITATDHFPAIFSKSFKSYPGAERIALLHEIPDSGMSLETAIKQRRSPSGFTGEAIALTDVAKLLFLAYGITAVRPYGAQNLIYYRAAPSAGAMYPLKIFVLPFQVEGLQAGVYHYNVKEHALEVLKLGDFSRRLYTAWLENELMLSASVAFIISAIFQRPKQKYGERGYRYVLMEAGHVGQNLYLTATAMQLACITIGGFVDDTVNQLLEIDGVNEAAIYLALVGRPSQAEEGRSVPKDC